ncbi:nitroreductase family deazaflavin-dependent oxidoreductase [Gordonia sp. CPCC 205333]|uniref:nitroreductase family deazaflavin-dependent oxidoreductase n=1 Tax=Gordonia sp. CPCC 205333 TaxID=3140790 RepID=UPI003AF36C20
MSFLTPLAIRVGSISWLPRFLPVIVRCDKAIQRVSRNRVALLDIAGLPNITLFVVGRKSGVRRSTRLLCAPVDGGWLVAGSYFGDHRTPAWVFNLRATDKAEVGVRGLVAEVAVAELAGADYDAGWQTLVGVWPNFTLYTTRTERKIPVFRLARKD